MKNIRTITRGNDGVALEFTSKKSSSFLEYADGTFNFTGDVTSNGQPVGASSTDGLSNDSLIPGATATDALNELGTAVSDKLDDVTAGTNITIDKTDPLNPVINASGGGAGETYFYGTFDAADTGVSTADSKFIGNFQAGTTITSLSGGSLAVGTVANTLQLGSNGCAFLGNVDTTGVADMRGVGSFGAGVVKGTHQVNGSGAAGFGYTNRTGTTINSDGNGSFVAGAATSNSGQLGNLVASGTGSIVLGNAYAYYYNSTITATGAGSFAAGYAYSYENGVSVIQSASSGSVAMGYAYGANVNANNGGILALGKATAGNGIVAGALGAVAIGLEFAEANNQGSTVIGKGLISNTGDQTVLGKYNSTTAPSAAFPLVLGWGTNSTTTDNIFAVSTTGEVYAKNATINTGIDYAETFEWADGNPKEEDRVGLFVKLDGDKLVLAEDDSEYLGVISATPNVVGDEGAMDWHGKYLKDDFGRVIYEDIEDPSTVLTAKEKESLTKLRAKEELSERESSRLAKLEAKEAEGATIISVPKLNPDYNPSNVYVPRQERREWDNVGLLGQLRVRDDNTATVGDYVIPTTGGIATKSSNVQGYKVIKRIKEGILQVLVK